MVPARNLLRRHYDNYGGWFGESQQDKPYLSSSSMAEEPSQPADTNADAKQDEAATSSKETDDWLQLGIGRHSSPTMDHPTTSSRQRLTELELFSDRPHPAQQLPSATMAITPVMPMLPMHGLSHRPWGFWNPNQMTAAEAPVPPPLPLQYSFRRFPCLPGSSTSPLGEMRVVSPPRRLQTGVWFVLQAARNQVREPFLPQIPRTFLRIKDGRMTVRLSMKYLVRKLGLHDESEVEITCRGQLLLPLLTLQHVRDNIWRPRAEAELNIDSRRIRDTPAADHVMILHYGRSST